MEPDQKDSVKPVDWPIGTSQSDDASVAEHGYAVDTENELRIAMARG